MFVTNKGQLGKDLVKIGVGGEILVGAGSKPALFAKADNFANCTRAGHGPCLKIYQFL